MSYLFIEYPKCSTCQKAKKWLENQNVNFETRHIVEETPTVEELQNWLEKSGLEIKKFFNTSGLVYKNMNLKEKLDQMTDAEKLRLLASNGMLIKRPILIGEDFVLVGFREEQWREKIRREFLVKNACILKFKVI